MRLFMIDNQYLIDKIVKLLKTNIPYKQGNTVYLNKTDSFEIPQVNTNYIMNSKSIKYR